MDILPTKIPGVYVVVLQPKGDDRGYFTRTYDDKIFANHGLQTQWVQENQSLSVLIGTLRGLHFQAAKAAETKLVRVLAGRIFDVAVDVRHGSPTFGHHVAVELSSANMRALYIPRGFAHGFCTMEENSIVAYKVDNYYSQDQERGLLWNDPNLNIAWPLEGSPACISDKDKKLPPLSDVSPVELSTNF